ncbi:TIGR04076 family protein [Promethearchaeum syntrophicum]|uniref:TIGR04076 family protein n=1 Tax=Promethearchaeum syntrophicum TaxID=2594042 RepID=A0A5B9DDG3_9ARCH|nr:TIGR04076 family protein [Candidatus Prometheoarchaeum syntrophicum]QEE16793.1 hypothetical protein DSAG12_02623 [Candidatus Prometheoarchaeum syntrophicum]
MARSKVKITVLKRVTPEYIFDGNVPTAPNGEKYTVCTAFKEGDEYMVEKNMRCPEGFCNYAWKDIFSDVRVLALGGDHEPWVEKPKMISCCTDGIRPVSFTLLRIDN